MSLVHVKELSSPHLKTLLLDVTDKLPFKPPCRIMFKNEYEQPSGSFKMRGIGNFFKESIEKARNLDPSVSIHVFTSSGGNAGLAAAYLAQFYGVCCTVAVPKNTKSVILEKLESYGAKILVFGDSINEADGHLRAQMEMVDKSVKKLYCHPFEDELIWQGHSTIIDELATQVPPEKIKGVVCSVGGGGLYNGIYQGLEKHKMKTDMLLIETAQAPTFTETIKRGEIFTLESVKSLATSLACSYLSKQSLENYQNQSTNRTIIEKIDDIDSVKAVVKFEEIFGTIIEPACGAAACVVLNRLDLLLKNFNDTKPDDIIVVIVCGGSCTDRKGLEEFKSMVYRDKL